MRDSLRNLAPLYRMKIWQLVLVILTVFAQVGAREAINSHGEALEVSIDGTMSRYEVVRSLGQDTNDIDGESLLRILRESENYLQSKTDSSVQVALDHVSSLVEQVERLQLLSASVDGTRQAVDELIRLANSRQLEYFMQKLKKALEQEMNLRSLDRRQNEQLSTEGAPFETVSLDALKRKFEIKHILEGSELELRQWVMNVIKEELGLYEENILSTMVGESNSDCASPVDVVHNVQSALMKWSQDGIGIVDYAQGGTIVHEMTSQSFVPMPAQSDLLGNVWWGKFVPQDWEELLPPGWQDWNVAIPSCFYHAFPSIRLQGAKTAPPESVLERSTHPGSCWPMNGTAGQITIRLPNPVRVSAISVDHISSLLASGDSRESAPKRIRVVGYPACEDGDQCGGSGFDSRDAIRLFELEFDFEGDSVQTFEINSGVPHSIASDVDSDINGIEDEGDADYDDESDPGSCSMNSSSCSSPPVVAGVTFQILDNWGNPDFTCLYRFRIHGDSN